MSEPNKKKSAKVSDIARYWGVSDATVRAVLKQVGAEPHDIKPTRYLWADVWAAEGTEYVDPRLESAFRRPLLLPQDVQAYFPELHPRSIRHRSQTGKLPAIKIGSEWRYREFLIQKAAAHG